MVGGLGLVGGLERVCSTWGGAYIPPLPPAPMSLLSSHLSPSVFAGTGGCIACRSSCLARVSNSCSARLPVPHLPCTCRVPTPAKPGWPPLSYRLSIPKDPH